jgi:hypothetical protein
MDEKAVIESADGEELASLNLAIKEKEQVLLRVRDRIAQIDQRQQEINAQYETYKQQIGKPLSKSFERRFAEPESAEAYSKADLKKMAYARLKQVASNIAVPSDQIPATSSKDNKKALIDAIRERQKSVQDFLSRSTTMLSPQKINPASSSASAPAVDSSVDYLGGFPDASMSEEDFFAELDRMRPRIDFGLEGVPEAPDEDIADLDEIVIGEGRVMRPFRTVRKRKVMIPRGMYDDSRNDFFKMRK